MYVLLSIDLHFISFSALFYTVNVLKFRTLFRAESHRMLLEQQRGKILIRLLLQKQSDLDLHCLSMPCWQSTIVRNFRSFTVLWIYDHFHILSQLAL